MTAEEFLKDARLYFEKKLFFICGQERYLIDAVRKAIEGGRDQMNIDIREDAGTDEIIKLAEQSPFFCDARILELKNLPLFKTGSADELIKYLNNIPDTTKIVFIYEGEPDKRKALYKHLKKNAVVIEADIAPERLIKWVMGHALKAGIKLDKKAAELLITVSGSDMYALSGEIDKLSFVDGKIDEKAILRSASKSPEYNVFLLHAHMLKKEYKEAFELLDEIWAAEKSYIPVTALLLDKFNSLYMARGCVDARMSQESAISTMMSMGKMSRGAAMYAIKECAGFSSAQLKKAIGILSDFEYALKSGGPNGGMEPILVKIYGA